MTLARKDFAGGSIITTLSSPINASDTTIAIEDATGWSVGSNGQFAVVIDPGLAGEEKVIIDTRSANLLTVRTSPGTGRGADGTSPAAHSAGAIIHQCLLAEDLDDDNSHIYDTGRDDHTQYLTTGRHDTTTRHGVASLGSPSAPADIGTAASTGTPGSVRAYQDHVHKIGTGAINSSGMLAANVVDSAAIGADQVGTSEVAPDAITGAELADDSVNTEHLVDGSVTHPALDPTIPWGYLDDGTATSDQLSIGSTATDLTNLSAAVTVGTNRRIKITVSLECDADNTDSYTDIFIKEGATQLKRGRIKNSSAGVGQEQSVQVTLYINAPSAGAHTYKVQIARNGSGTGTVGLRAGSNNPAQIIVEDIGGV